MRHPRRRRTGTLIAAGLIPVAGALIASATSDVTATPTATAPAGTEILAPPTAVTAVAATFAPPAPKSPPSVLNGDVPAVNFEAYQAAADTMAHDAPRCGVDWKLIAGIGKVESHHANFGDADPDGTLRTPIYGPVLDGSLAGNRVITDTDGGELDGDPAYDRAVGPMQFLPSTWKHYAADGNGDGKIDPQNLFDAALTTARYLCDEDLDLRTEAAVTTAVLRYNNSMAYVGKVLGFSRTY